MEHELQALLTINEKILATLEANNETLVELSDRVGYLSDRVSDIESTLERIETAQTDIQNMLEDAPSGATDSDVEELLSSVADVKTELTVLKAMLRRTTNG